MLFGLKDDLGCTAAELVYGTSLRLPGKHHQTHQTPRAMLHSSSQQYGSCDHHPLVLLSDSHVLTQHWQLARMLSSATRKPLQQPYDGPFRVLKQDAKYYTVDINGRHDTVSLDRLKPTFYEQSGVPTTSTRNEQSPEPSSDLTHIHPPTHSCYHNITPLDTVRTTRPLAKAFAGFCFYWEGSDVESTLYRLLALLYLTCTLIPCACVLGTELVLCSRALF